ncbi:ER membrane protein complex subunit 6-like [Tigriopus californicus]|nr:ER membrane protein complex subunit 6-like [Tigriopus californicus]|eukprot:TCALIF_00727-PA protein Name:"Similar to emc6 ER membrane protein complex subunit 6 (Xenopus laevis)" AED:0.00 eAED:0.00 QI:0/-1/0/1/-1/1/1/0/114
MASSSPLRTARPHQPMPLNPRNVMLNTKSLNFSRTALSVLGGGVAGILGLTSILGFLFYFAASGLLGLVYLMQSSRSDGMFFLSKQQLVTSYVFENLFTYILMWTLVYGCVHVY